MTAEIVSAIQHPNGTCVFVVAYDGVPEEPITYSPPTLEEGETFDASAYAQTCVQEVVRLVRARVAATKTEEAVAAAIDPAQPTPQDITELAFTGPVIT